MSDARKLHEKRANLLTEAQSIVTDLAEKGEALEGESQARFEKLTSEAATVAAAIRSEKEATEARSAADAVRAEYATAIAPKVEKTEGSNDELRALARNGGVQLFEYRDVSRSTGLGNPVTIADRVNVVAAQFNPFIDPAIVTVVRASTGNNIQFPRVTALGTAGSVAEAGTIAESDGTLSALSLTPVKYATIIQVTEELGVRPLRDDRRQVRRRSRSCSRCIRWYGSRGSGYDWRNWFRHGVNQPNLHRPCEVEGVCEPGVPTRTKGWLVDERHDARRCDWSRGYGWTANLPTRRCEHSRSTPRSTDLQCSTYRPDR